MKHNIMHHISDDLLLEYASGALAEGFSIAVATHLALCPSCRKRLAAMEGVGGEMLASMVCAPSAQDDSWAEFRDRLQYKDPRPATKATPFSADRLNEADRAIPEPLRSYLGGSLTAVKWRPLGLGAFHYPIATGEGGASARLLRIPAGKPVPEHGHAGRELTLVLSGAFTSQGDYFGPGDLEEEDSDSEHQPVATPERECICLAVTDAPLRFKSRLVRLLQPLLGI
ncbi:transcriptional regulator [Martelella alba]|uniref:Transcriptional regulator n=1 Tax=Martelella alba TaxID=2590451 RepID=A0A506UIX9_9HYPH|nr:ChrR family anti-sigma-E factor [Martelella alba]TPW33262.1 transcriptional regulator [Martelella alba]